MESAGKLNHRLVTAQAMGRWPTACMVDSENKTFGPELAPVASQVGEFAREPGQQNMSGLDADEHDFPQRGMLPLSVSLSDGRTLTLRETSVEDAAEICEMLPKCHDETDCLNYLPGEFQMTVDEERIFIRDQLRSPKSILLAAVVDGRIVGLGGAMIERFRRMDHHAELGISVLKDFWHLGVGQSIMATLIEWGQRKSLRKMYLRVFSWNDRGQTFYAKMGFVQEACLRQNVRRGSGELGDTIVMARDYPQ